MQSFKKDPAEFVVPKSPGRCQHPGQGMAQDNGSCDSANPIKDPRERERRMAGAVEDDRAHDVPSNKEQRTKPDHDSRT